MKYELTEGLIKELHQRATSFLKEKIEEQVPELFENKLEVGKWYIDKRSGHLFCCTEIGSSILGYGISQAGWFTDDIGDIYFNHLEATKEEVEEALIKEAKKRGFKEGVKVMELNNNKETLTSGGFHSTSIGWLSHKSDCKYDEDGAIIFGDGKWAEIITEPIKEVTIEEIQEKYGCKIKIVE